MKEWEIEPDSLNFIHNNLRCEIKRHPQGHLNMYVLLPETNIYYGIGDQINSLIRADREISYTAQDGSFWKVGMSFSHLQDFIPNMPQDGWPDFMKDIEIFIGHTEPTETEYRNIESAIEAVKKLADILSVKSTT